MAEPCLGNGPTPLRHETHSVNLKSAAMQKLGCFEQIKGAQQCHMPIRKINYQQAHKNVVQNENIAVKPPLQKRH